MVAYWICKKRWTTRTVSAHYDHDLQAARAVGPFRQGEVRWAAGRACLDQVHTAYVVDTLSRAAGLIVTYDRLGTLDIQLFHSYAGLKRKWNAFKNFETCEAAFMEESPQRRGGSDYGSDDPHRREVVRNRPTATGQSTDERIKNGEKTAAQWTEKGAALAARGEVEEALHCYDRAIAIDPEEKTAQIQKGMCLKSMGRPDDALQIPAWAKVVDQGKLANCNWSKVSTTGPSARFGSAIAYDSNRQVTVLFGGNDDQLSPETWEWDGVVWRQVANTGPSGREEHAMVFDTARGVTVLFGGFDGAIRDDTWEWDGCDWKLAASSGPSERKEHSMAYDSTRCASVLFGGSSESDEYLRDTWIWDGIEWVRAATTGPSARIAHAMCYDSARCETVLFGGSNNSEAYLGDTWKWDGTIWKSVTTNRSPARYDAAIAYDSERHVSVLFAGWCSSFIQMRDTWVWDGDRWTNIASGGPYEGVGRAMAFDTTRNAIVLVGGGEETWEWRAD